jgi:tetratricopeptide (TPR) repeat protein
MNTIPDLIHDGFSHWNEPERLARIGSELESRTRLPQARIFLERAISLAPEHPEPYSSLAFAYFRDAVNYSEEGENAMVDGIEATNSDVLKAWYAALQEDESIATLLIEEVRQSEDITVQFTLAGSLLWRGRTEESYALFQKTIARMPDGATPKGLDSYCSSMCWMSSQKPEINLERDILPHVKNLIRTSPETYSFRALELQVFQVLKNWQRVKEIAHGILHDFRDEETTMLALAIAYEKLEQLDHAILWLNRAIGAKPSFVRARINLARIYESQEKLDLAEEIMREIPLAFPEYNFGKINLAMFLYRIGKHDEAIALFRATYSKLKPWEKTNAERSPEGKAMLESL